MNLVILLVLCTITFCLTAMVGAYASLSKSYVKHWARRGDSAAKALFPLKARGHAVVIVLEMLRALSISASILLLGHVIWPWLAWLVAASVLFVGFVVISEIYLRQLGMRLLILGSSTILLMVDVFKPVASPLGNLLDRYIGNEQSSLTKADILKMLSENSGGYTDLSADELRILRHALVFGEKTVHDCMTPKSVMKSVRQDDILSPVLLDELHKSGHSRFPVFDETGEEATGLLFIRDLVEVKTHSKVSEVLHARAYFVNEDRELDHVLQAFLRTKQHLFVVVNSFAEIVGLITIEDIVEQILGRPIIDEFDRYDDMRQVAAAQAKVVAKKRAKQEV